MKQATSEIGSYEVDRSTHFLFEHKVFTLKGARFALTEDGSTPAFHVELGALVASLPMGTLRAEFSFDRIRRTASCWRSSKRASASSKRSAPVNSIPRELLDGTASWSVEERHRVRAKAHLWARAINTDATFGAKDDVLEAFVARPETATKLNAAAKEIATKLGYEMTGESVRARIEDLWRELAYIEALQDALRRSAEHRAEGQLNWCASIAATARSSTRCRASAR